MPKSSLFGGRRASADVNVINADVQRSARRRAKTALIVSGVITWALAWLVLASYLNVILAGFLAALIAVPVAVCAFVLVLIWPVVRILIHWSAEIALGAGVLAGMTGLSHLMPGPVVVLVVFAVGGGLLLPPPVRYWTVAVAWCVISRHRLRMSFAAYIRGNREGTLPFILHAKPTPVGESVWVWLRPGLSRDELANRGDQLAVSCWAKSVVVEQASTKYAALVRFDIKRRDTLSGAVASPLVDVPEVPARDGQSEPADVTALDLTDVTEASVTIPTQPADKKPAAVKYTPNPKPTTKPADPVVVSASGEDVSDYL